MARREPLRIVASVAFCFAAVLFLWGICQVLGVAPLGAAGYLDASFHIVEGIACLVFGAQAASMVRPPRQTQSTWASLPYSVPSSTVHSTLSRVTYALCALGTAFVGVMHAVLAWQLAGYVPLLGVSVAVLALAALVPLFAPRHRPRGSATRVK